MERTYDSNYIWNKIFSGTSLNTRQDTNNILNLVYDETTDSLKVNITGLPAATPASPDTSIQFNNGGAFAGLSIFTFDVATNSFQVGSNTVTGTYSSAFGITNSVSGNYALAFGSDNVATGTSSFAHGRSTRADGNYSLSLGNSTEAFGIASMAAGLNTKAYAIASQAFGNFTFAIGDNSFAAGSYNIVNGDNAHVEGNGNFVTDLDKSSNITSVNVPSKIINVVDGSLFNIGDEVAYVYECELNQNLMHKTTVTNIVMTSVYVQTAVDVSGCVSNAWNDSGSILFNLTTGFITDSNAHAEGSYCVASHGTNPGEYTPAHVEGRKCVATEGGHSEGGFTFTSGGVSHAEGNQTRATGWCSHSEGNGTEASANGAHAEGDGTVASGNYSHAGGVNTIASGTGTVVIGSNGVTGAQDYTTYVTALKLKGITAPASPEEGNIYFDSGTKHFMGYNGTSWKQLDV